MENLIMSFAQALKHRGTCKRLKVGAVITSSDLTQIYAYGYNGNAKGFSNECERDEPGNCGCIHAESNALIKVRVNDLNKVMFCTTSPCPTCAKLIINSGFSKIYYLQDYRLPDEVISKTKIELIKLS